MRKRTHWLVLSLSLAPLLVFFQNCSKVDFGELPSSELDGSQQANDQTDQNERSTKEVDEVVRPLQDNLANPIVDIDDDGPGECVEGREFSVWIRPDASKGITDQNNVLGQIVSFEGSRTAKDNYNYYSASAHPRIGPVPRGFELHVFLYEGSDGLALNFYANIDAGGSPDNQVDLNIDVSDNLATDKVILSDDRAELKRVASGTTLSRYEGRFHYWNNTDGGVIGPLAGKDFVIRLDMKKLGDLSTARFYSADGKSFLLKDRYKNIREIFIGYNKVKKCSS